MTAPMAQPEYNGEDVVGIVLSGAGARGAYEAGVLSVLLPLLEGAARPRIVVGTSAGALNAAMLASAIGKGLDPVTALTTQGWERINPDRVFATPRRSLLRLAEGWLRRRAGVARGLLDTDVLRTTLLGMLPDPNFASGVAHGALDAVAVVASACSSDEAVVFFESAIGAAPTLEAGDSASGVRYVRTALGVDHLMASSAFPLAFPARWITGPGEGWYLDGGAHLNTPIKPAIDLGANRILVIGATAWDVGPPVESNPPNMMDGNGQLLHAMLVDGMRAEVHALSAANEQLMASSAPTSSAATSLRAPTRGVVEFCVVKPDDDSLSDVAARIWPSGGLRLLRSLGGYPALGPVTSQRQRPGEFLSYLCFRQDFISEAIASGQRDARRLIGPTEKIPWGWRLKERP